MSHVSCPMCHAKVQACAFSVDAKCPCVCVCVVSFVALYTFCIYTSNFFQFCIEWFGNDSSQIHEHAKHPSIARLMNTLPVVKPDNFFARHKYCRTNLSKSNTSICWFWQINFIRFDSLGWFMRIVVAPNLHNTIQYNPIQSKPIQYIQFECGYDTFVCRCGCPWVSNVVHSYVLKLRNTQP